MATAAPNAGQPVVPPPPLLKGPSPDAPIAGVIGAIIDRPHDRAAILGFLAALGQLDPAAPRSDRLTTALRSALSAGYLVEPVQHFAERSLVHEINAMASSDKDQLPLPEGTLALITCLWHHHCTHSIVLEHFGIRLRGSLLALARTGEDAGTARTRLAEAMARHSFANENIWAQTDAEAAEVDKLVDRVSRQIETGQNVAAFALFMIGAYRPLDRIRAVRDWVLGLARDNVAKLDPTLRLLVFDRLQEDHIQIDTLTPIESEVSAKVRAQYEENPYPRWRHLPKLFPYEGLSSYVASNLPPDSKVPTLDASSAKVLIAGAGTGRHPIEIAHVLPSAAVLAIDLSRASLAYATRESVARGLRNVSFAQADILRLAEADVAFDLIESVGVLHHMDDPEAGLSALSGVLKPGGFMKLGLYSKIARRGINVARAVFSTADLSPGLEGIRAFRRALLCTEDPELAAVLQAPDFFSASMFRDAVMHVQEHQFSLPQIEAMLRRNGLKFLGFSNASARDALSDMPAKMAQRRHCDLKAWDRFERRNPDTFLGMYQFFCVKR